MVAVRVYVEGGGNTNEERAPLREAMGGWIAAALSLSRSPVRVIACGGRQRAFEQFRSGCDANPEAVNVLLVDSESLVTTASRWVHVEQREGDGWIRPQNTGEVSLHFMSQTLEAWLCADPEALGDYFGSGFRAAKLPKRKDLESEPKADLYAKLSAATVDSKKGSYHKQQHVRALLTISPTKVRERCRHADIFVRELASQLGVQLP